MSAAYDVIVRVTVTADSPLKARRIVERFLPDPANESNQHVEHVPGGHSPRGYPCSRKCNAAPNFPVDSWALLTNARVVKVDANAKRDRVHWRAVEVS